MLQALSFTNDTDKVAHGSDTELDDLPQGAILALIYPTNIDTNPPPHIMDKRSTGWSAFYINTNGGNGILGYQKSRSSTTLTINSAANFLVADRWQWVACTFDINGANADQKVFASLLGHSIREPDSYDLQTVGSGTIDTDAGGTLSVGGINSSGTYQLDGRCAIAILWNTQLDVEMLNRQITNIIEDNGKIVQLGNCVLYCEYAKYGTGAQLDRSFFENDGTITGAVVGEAPPIPLLITDPVVEKHLELTPSLPSTMHIPWLGGM